MGTPRRFPDPPTLRLRPPSRKLSKKLPERVREIREENPRSEVEVWAQDEMRLGLKPVVRRVWAPRGQRPKARFRRRYEWLYLYGFVRPQSGELHWLILPRVDAEVFSLALSHFAEEVGAGEERGIVLVLEQAGWHTGKEVEIPKGASTWSSCPLARATAR